MLLKLTVQTIGSATAESSEGYGKITKKLVQSIEVRLWGRESKLLKIGL